MCYAGFSCTNRNRFKLRDAKGSQHLTDWLAGSLTRATSRSPSPLGMPAQSGQTGPFLWLSHEVCLQTGQVKIGALTKSQQTRQNEPPPACITGCYDIRSGVNNR